jgi:N-acetylneuraminic acid mutarotase
MIKMLVHFLPLYLFSCVFLVVEKPALLGVKSCCAEEFKATAREGLKPTLKIRWRLGPDYPMGIQDSAVGIIRGKVISAGGFTRHPQNIRNKYLDAFGGLPSGFTKLTFVFDPQNETAGWKRVSDMPGPARQGTAVAVVDNMLYAMGGINYTEPFTYRDTYRLQEKENTWVWDKLETCQLPWPVYGAANSTVVIGKKLYLLGVADYFQGPGARGPDFHSEAGRNGSPVGQAMLVLNTARLRAGWKRLADCPGVPKCNSAVAAVGSKIYQLGGIFAPLAQSDLAYYNAVDSWMYDPERDKWTRLQDLPHGSNRRALAYGDRYIVLISVFKYAKTRNLDGTVTDVYNAEEKSRRNRDRFEKTVLVYDTKTGRLGTANELIEPTCYPSSAVVGDTIYCLGGEGGPRLYHPATLQIGKVVEVIPE